MRHSPRDNWRPTDTALMLWGFFFAILVGLLVTTLLGHPFDVLP
jgi:hypothetical protein